MAQVSRHFHPRTGRLLFFYPSLLNLVPGEPVLLDVTFISFDQHCPLRGTVLSRESGGQFMGSWLEFGAAGLVESLQTPKRRQRRFATDALITLERTEGMPFVGRLMDVGFGGARISGTSVRAVPGDRVWLSRFSPTGATPVIGARVSWARASDLGVQFVRPSVNERAAIEGLVEEAKQLSDNAYEVTHPSFCRCLEGMPVLEPALPRAAHRQTGSS